MHNNVEQYVEQYILYSFLLAISYFASQVIYSTANYRIQSLRKYNLSLPSPCLHSISAVIKVFFQWSLDYLDEALSMCIGKQKEYNTAMNWSPALTMWRQHCANIWCMAKLTPLNQYLKGLYSDTFMVRYPQYSYKWSNYPVFEAVVSVEQDLLCISIRYAIVALLLQIIREWREKKTVFQGWLLEVSMVPGKKKVHLDDLHFQYYRKRCNKQRDTH